MCTVMSCMGLLHMNLNVNLICKCNSISYKQYRGETVFLCGGRELLTDIILLIVLFSYNYNCSKFGL